MKGQQHGQLLWLASSHEAETDGAGQGHDDRWTSGRLAGKIRQRFILTQGVFQIAV